jgi:2-hydroxycyclohexanecarboxyl-CoA dehydrogenase
MGLSIAEHLAARGNAVAVWDVDGEAAARAADGLQSNGARALGCAVDVSVRADVDRAMTSVHTEFGPVGIMVTSAGIAAFAPFTEITEDAWNRMFAVNVTGTFHCLQAAIPDMVAAHWGRIVTIASSAGQIGSVRQAHYSASKGAVIALTRTLSREYARDGITVNTIPPFLVDTPMARDARDAGNIPTLEAMSAVIPVGRPGTGDDIAAACAFLCSDEASYITGQVIGVNGGAVG